MTIEKRKGYHELTDEQLTALHRIIHDDGSRRADGTECRVNRRETPLIIIESKPLTTILDTETGYINAFCLNHHTGVHNIWQVIQYCRELDVDYTT